MNNNGDDLPHDIDLAGAHQNGDDGEGQGGGAGGDEAQQALFPGAPQNGVMVNPVTRGLNGFTTAMQQLEAARKRIDIAVTRIEQEPVIVPVHHNRPVLSAAFQDSMLVIADSCGRIQVAMDEIREEFNTDNDLDVFPAEVRTIEVAVRMISTSAMTLHSILVFNSELRLDGHGPRYRIQCGFVDMHLALSTFQRYLAHFFSLEPQGFVYEDAFGEKYARVSWQEVKHQSSSCFWQMLQNLINETTSYFYWHFHI